MYDIASKFTKNSPLPCWKGYERVPGTAQGAKGSCRKASPATKKQKGGGTRKTCLPKAKLDAMSKKERQRLVAAKQKSGKEGEYKRPASTNVKGAREPGSTLRDWFNEDWVQVNNPSKKCGEA